MISANNTELTPKNFLAACFIVAAGYITFYGLCGLIVLIGNKLNILT